MDGLGACVTSCAAAVEAVEECIARAWPWPWRWLAALLAVVAATVECEAAGTSLSRGLLVPYTSGARNMAAKAVMTEGLATMPGATAPDLAACTRTAGLLTDTDNTDAGTDGEAWTC